MKPIIKKLAVLLLAAAALCATGCSKAKTESEKDNDGGEYITKAAFDQYQTVVSGTISRLEERVRALESYAEQHP